MIKFHKGDFYLGEELLGGNDARESLYHLLGKMKDAISYLEATADLPESAGDSLKASLYDADRAIRQLVTNLENVPVADGSTYRLKDVTME